MARPGRSRSLLRVERERNGRRRSPQSHRVRRLMPGIDCDRWRAETRSEEGFLAPSGPRGVGHEHSCLSDGFVFAPFASPSHRPFARSVEGRCDGEANGAPPFAEPELRSRGQSQPCPAHLAVSHRTCTPPPSHSVNAWDDKCPGFTRADNRHPLQSTTTSQRRCHRTEKTPLVLTPQRNLAPLTGHRLSRSTDRQ